MKNIVKLTAASIFAAVMGTIWLSGPSNAEALVKVQPGDTLSSIADQNNTTYVRLFNANEKLTNPRRFAGW